MVFLVNIDNVHWVVIVLYNLKKTAVIYDSMRSYEAQSRHWASKILGAGRNEPNYAVCYECSPAQQNTSDCGVFALINVICAVDKQTHKG